MQSKPSEFGCSFVFGDLLFPILYFFILVFFEILGKLRSFGGEDAEKLDEQEGQDLGCRETDHDPLVVVVCNFEYITLELSLAQFVVLSYQEYANGEVDDIVLEIIHVRNVLFKTVSAGPRRSHGKFESIIEPLGIIGDEQENRNCKQLHHEDQKFNLNPHEH